MKVRTGFVSNSSSSSFICSVCEGMESGWDMTLGEAYMVQFSCGHLVHEDCLDPEVLKKLRKIGEYPYDIPPEHCPLCKLTIVCPKDETLYLRNKLGLTKEQVHQEMQNNHELIEELRKTSQAGKK